MTEIQSLTIPATREAILDLPTTTGVYQFISKGELIYIGKSVSLKARLLSHLENAKSDAKEAAIVNNADKITCIVTDSEFKALLLESQLISKHKPKYNVRWRDDKSYLYIKVTTKEEYPKLFLSRKETFDKNASYFGPFQGVKTATNVLREIRKVFPFCTQKKISKSPCFYSKIGQCNPCPNAIEQIQDKELQTYYKKLYRHNIKQAIRVLEGQTDLVLKTLYKDLKDLTEQEKYEEAIQVRNRVFRLEGLIHGRRLEPENLTEYNMSSENIQALMQLLRKYLPDIQNLHRIECYDISNLSQKNITASMVVFTDGLIDKKEYKRFKIKNENIQSDFEAMDEVLKRRLRHHQWEQPNLLVVDGGKPQVRVAQRILAEMNVSIPLIGIAKRPDRLIIGDESLLTVRPPLNNAGFNLIRAIRDESHRFAKKYHTLLRDQNMLHS